MQSADQIKKIIESAFECEANGEYGKALEFADQFLAETTAHGKPMPSWQAFRGRCLRELGKPEEAEAAFRLALRLNESMGLNESERYWCELAETLKDQDKFSEAIECCKQALRLNGNYDPAWFTMGTCYRNQHDLCQAEQALRRALELDSEYSAYHMELGRILLFANTKLDEGIQAILRAIELDPENDWAHLHLAQYLAIMGEYEGAEEHFQKALALCPGFTLAKVEYGRFLMDGIHDCRAAARYFQESLQEFPFDSQLTRQLGRCYLFLTEFEEARKYLQDAQALGDKEAARLLQMLP